MASLLSVVSGTAAVIKNGLVSLVTQTDSEEGEAPCDASNQEFGHNLAQQVNKDVVPNSDSPSQADDRYDGTIIDPKIHCEVSKEANNHNITQQVDTVLTWDAASLNQVNNESGATNVQSELSPEEIRIIGQVEFYFSDENLPSDKFLLKETEGPVNKPVPVARIHAFKKMQVYQPYSSVVAALRKSSKLIITGISGCETLQRATPLTQELIDHAGGVAKEKKKKKSKTERLAINAKAAEEGVELKYKVLGKKDRGTGFEDFYADPPQTIAEYDEESELYHHSRSFVERIEMCIQRFRAKRKLDPFKTNVFTQYLVLGGVDSGAKTFGTGHLDRSALEESNAAEIAQTYATDHVDQAERSRKFYSSATAEHWSVDFTSIVKGFLSVRAPRVFGFDDKARITTYCNVIHNFLNYVLSHSVCPEYTQDLIEAGRVCDVAAQELWSIHNISPCMPGEFNKAASTLFEGQYYKSYMPQMTITTEDGTLIEPVQGMKDDKAARIVQTAIAFLGSNAEYDKYESAGKQAKVVRSEEKSFEIVEIIIDDEVQRLYAGIKSSNLSEDKVTALGTMVVKEWKNPEDATEDLTEAEEIADALHVAHANLSLSTLNLNPLRADDEADLKAGLEAHMGALTKLWFDTALLRQMSVGMKFGGTLHELDIGVKYLDQLTGIYTSFFTYLPNERMSHWKEPRPNDRAPPRAGGVAQDEYDGMDQRDLD